MCGIAGFYFKDLNDEAKIRQMSASIQYRGPDENGIFIDQGLHLAHQRLSIIDLGNGQQPMIDQSQNYIIVFNGEIYNFKELKATLKNKYQFRTSSDTEVLLYAYIEYKEDVLKHLNGMFSFCIYNKREQSLFLARDRLGQKPLYYYHQNQNFAFSSELHSFWTLPWIDKKIDQRQLGKYFAYEYVPSPGTLFKNIFKLPPGYFLKYNLKQNTVQTRQWWNADVTPDPIQIPYNDAKEELIKQLHRSIQYRMIADVPIGVFLSGGVDSSTCLAMIRQNFPNQKIQTFSISFENKSFDESQYASEMAKKFNTEHIVKKLDPKTLIEVLPTIRQQMHDPLADASIIPTYLLCKHAAKHVKVAIGGDAADELLCGYPTFLAHQVLQHIRIPTNINNFILNLSQKIPVNMNNLSLDFKIKQTIRGLSYSNPIRNQIWLGAYELHEIKQLLPDLHDLQQEELFTELEQHWSSSGSAPFLQKVNHLYLNTYLTDDINMKVDRASMMNSLEVRAPFLDVNTVEFINRLPSSYKLKGKMGKHILKDAMSSLLPHEILYRPKHGFSIPISHWFKNELKDILKEEIEKAPDCFNKDYLMKIYNEHQQNKFDHRKKLFSFFMAHHLIP